MASAIGSSQTGSTEACNENSGIGKWQGSLGDMTSLCMLLLPLTTKGRNTSEYHTLRNAFFLWTTV